MPAQFRAFLDELPNGPLCLLDRLIGQRSLDEEDDLLAVRAAIILQFDFRCGFDRQPSQDVIALRQFHPAAPRHFDCAAQHGPNFLFPLVGITGVAPDCDLLDKEIGLAPETDSRLIIGVIILINARSGHDDFLLLKILSRQRSSGYR